ncbi:MAG: substrate-binding domain-containing protein [Pseudobutyrivibrio sp.]|nr:substrate-binding domain-containing protein [Pseudobutyrivibrio sp.]
MTFKNSWIKKAILMALIIVMSLSTMTACGSIDSFVNAGEESAAKSGVRIYFLMTDVDQPYRKALADGVVKAAGTVGAYVTVDFCGESVVKQVEKIEAAAASGDYDAIICRLVDISTALQIEIAAGDLPVVFINNEPSADYLNADKYVYAGSYEEDAGTYQAEYVWNKLGKPRSLDIVILEGAEGHSGTIGRTKAVKYFFLDNGVDANIVFMDYAKWTAEGAYEKLEMFKNTKQNFDCIFCNNDTMAEGAVRWLKDNGYNPADCPVVGVDATAEGCKLVKSGDMYMTVLQDADGQGTAAVEACAKMAKNQSISDIDGASKDLKYIWVPFVPVDASNVSKYQ